MKLTLSNVGKFEHAEIDLNGITVLAGENNTGKSTLSKSLYCVFNSFSHNGSQINNEKKNKVVNLLRNYHREADGNYLDIISLRRKIGELIEENSFTPEILIEIYENIQGNRITETDKESLLGKLKEVCSISDHEIQTTILKRYLLSEFGNQTRNIYNDGNAKIQLCIKGNTVDISLDENDEIDYVGNFDLITEALYLDDPSILDDIYGYLGRANFNEHREMLRRKFYAYNNDNDVLDEILTNKKLDNILSLINSACDGSLFMSERSWLEYRLPDKDKTINIKNVSMGLKSFAILKSLLLNGNIKERATLILDEPEVHLHPKWQLIFAEIIVLLQKEFNLTILLNTHSPYFMEAIEVYSRKHNINDKVKFYLTEANEQFATIKDSTDNIETIYKKLAEPYQTLYNVRAQND